jgi:dolichol-phosphate mannosyltransferase
MKVVDLTLEVEVLSSRYDLVVVMPMYNEAENIEKVLSDWSIELKANKLDYLFVLVNDGSTDKTEEIVRGITGVEIVLINKRNSGHGRSVRLGYDYAVQCVNAEFVLQIDSDGQCDPTYFKEFWKLRLDFDFLIGSRVARGDGLPRLLTSRVSTLLSSLVVKRYIYDANTPYRLIRKDALKEILHYIRPSFDIHNVAVTYVAYWLDLRVKRLEISFPERAGGENSINLRSVYHLGSNMLFELSKLYKSLNK